MDKISSQKSDVKQFKIHQSAGTSEGIGIKRQELLRQRMHCSIFILILGRKKSEQRQLDNALFRWLLSPREWLTDMLAKIPYYNNDYSHNLSDLLPHNWKDARELRKNPIEIQ